MIVIALDTNFVAPRILHGGKRKEQDINLLDRLVFLQSKDKIEISFPKTTQAEVYAILRAGRMRVRSKKNNKREPVKFPHHIIMRFVHRYKELFDVEFMDSLKDVPGIDDEKTYKESLFREIEFHLKMKINQQLEYVKNKGIDISNCKDPYDYYIMVSTLQDSADYLVTNNPDDFPNPLGNCKVITDKEVYSILPMYP